MKHKFYFSSIVLIILLATLTSFANQLVVDSDSVNYQNDYGNFANENVDLPLASGLSKYLGCAYGGSSKADFAKYWNQVVSENAGKWGSAEPVRDVFSWTALDEAYNFAQKNGFPYRHHVLIWGNQQPAWIEKLSDEEQLEEIREWFSAIAERYPDIEIVEVVNEPLHDPPKDDNNPSTNGEGQYFEALGGTGETGYDWILNAFRIAREYFPSSTKLMMNDYSIVNDGNATSKYVKIIELLKKENLIDAIGVQGHYFSLGGSASTMTQNLNTLGKTGLPIYVTEMDIDGPTDEKQLSEYERIFPVFWENPNVAGITLWGFKPGMWRTEQKAYLVNADGSERAAMEWLRDYLKGFVSAEIIDSKDDIFFYPNPVTTGHIYFSNISKVRSIKILDINGRKQFENDFENQNNFNLQIDLKPGIYLIQFIEQDKTSTEKIVIK